MAARSNESRKAGKSTARAHRLISPDSVVIRQSTDIMLTNDPLVDQAVSFIRTHALDRIKLADVLEHVAVSRATLEQRMKAAIGRTIHKEIQRVQIETVKDLLCNSDLPIKQIARRCGFKYTQHLARVFREATKKTLAEFRNNATRRRF